LRFNLKNIGRGFGFVAMLGLCAISLVSAGCQSAMVKTPVDATYSKNDSDSQMDFWHGLADRPVTCNDDAFHALLLYTDSHDDAKTYDDRVAALKAKGLLPKSFSGPANRAIERGVLAVAIVKLTGIKGGWVMRVFGPTPRYAVKELEYTGLFPPSSPQQTFSGAEFVGIMGKLDDFQQPVASEY
jgi:hypothetical protein